MNPNDPRGGEYIPYFIQAPLYLMSGGFLLQLIGWSHYLDPILPVPMLAMFTCGLHALWRSFRDG